jgi:LPXTG-motif cell wall-anchored protein
MPAKLPQRGVAGIGRVRSAAGIRVRRVSWSPRRLVVVPFAVVMLAFPAVAGAQNSTIPENGAGVSTTPPVPLKAKRSAPNAAAAANLPNTGTDPRMLFLTGLAMSLLGAGLRLRTADADDY